RRQLRRPGGSFVAPAAASSPRRQLRRPGGSFVAPAKAGARFNNPVAGTAIVEAGPLDPAVGVVGTVATSGRI
ncbi:MAG: hypothetical protein ACXWF6_07475, partial [Usitatibacter sp.]